MSNIGRPRIVTEESLVEAGRTITLPKLTVRAVATHLGVSEMSVYRRVGSLDGLRRVVAEGLIVEADFSVADNPDPEDALVGLAHGLRNYVQANPGIGEFLTNLSESSPRVVQHIEESQADFAARYALDLAKASILVSVVAENAIALATLNPQSLRADTSPLNTTNTPTIGAGVAAVSKLSPEDKFAWSIRASTRGAMVLLGLPTRSDDPLL